MSGKFVRFAGVLAALMGASPASAEYLNADEARHFIAGRQFSYQCFEGTYGRGRIHADGSVSGYISIRGTQAPRFVVLPPGTLRVRGDQYCASMRGMPFEPCFNLNKTDERSFRGSVSGLGFAYCDFTRRVNVAGTSPLPSSPKPPSSDATAVALRGAN